MICSRRLRRLGSWAGLVLMASHAAWALDAEPMHHHHAMMGTAHDTRTVVQYPAAMKAATLANMREHLSVLSDSVALLAAGKNAAAATLIETRLGLQSPSAQGCEHGTQSANPLAPAPAQASPAPSMEASMNAIMPEKMQQLGVAMHRAASDWAVVIRKAKPGALGEPLKAMSLVTAQCVACHAAYRIETPLH